jgi:hypothetical protein
MPWRLGPDLIHHIETVKDKHAINAIALFEAFKGVVVLFAASLDASGTQGRTHDRRTD